jgi:hypothetical protein
VILKSDGFYDRRTVFLITSNVRDGNQSGLNAVPPEHIINNNGGNMCRARLTVEQNE